MKNKSLIMSIVSAAAGLLGLVFLALPFVPEVSGYDTFKLFELLGQAPISFVDKIIYFIPLFVLIMSIILIGFGIVNILGALKIVKSEKFLKISKIIVFVVACIFVAFVLFTFIYALIKNWGIAAGLILLLVTGIAALVASILDKKLQEK